MESSKLEHSYSVPFFMKGTVVLIVSLIALWWRSSRKRGFPPGPLGVPLLGYLIFLRKSIPERLAQLGEIYGSIFSLNLGGKDCVVLNGFDVTYEALVKRSVFFSGRQMPSILQDFGSSNGLIWRDYGPGWKNLRKFGISTLKGFGVGKRSMEDRINQEIRYLLEEIRSKQAEPLAIQEILSSAVCNVICSILCGERYEYDDLKFKKLLEMMTERFTGTGTAKKLSIMNRFPRLRYLPGFRTACETLVRQVNFTKATFHGIIDEHRKTYDPCDTRDFIDAFIKEMDKDEEGHFNRDVLDVVMRDLFLAGTETTTTTMRWCFLYLAYDNDLQDRLREEIQSVFGNSGTLSMEKGERMPLTRSFIHEVQRTRPIIPLVWRKTTESVKLREYIIPRNTEIIINLWQIHHDSKNFVDPFKFWPQRFLDEKGNFRKHDRVIPYSIGPRYCLGMHLAEMEVFMFLIGILRNFRIVEDENYPLPSLQERVEGIVHSPIPYRAKFIILS